MMNEQDACYFVDSPKLSQKTLEIKHRLERDPSSRCWKAFLSNRQFFSPLV